MGSKVYLVSSGEYSDYHIDALFSTREIAETFAERVNAAGGNYPYGDECRVQEFDVLDEAPEVVPCHAVSAVLRPDGTIVVQWHSQKRADPSESGYELADFPKLGPGEGIRLSVSGKRTEAEAMKAIHDLAARVKAERAGIA